MILINLKIMKIIVIRWKIYYFKGCKPARWLHGIGGAALLGEISATICVCRNPYIRFRGRWERRGILLGCERQHVDGCLPGPFLRKGGGIIKIFTTIICSKQCAPRIWLHWILAGVRLLSPRRCLSDSVLAWKAVSALRLAKTDWTLENRKTPWYENSAQ